MSLVQKNNFLATTIMKNANNKVNIFLAVALVLMFMAWVKTRPVAMVEPKKEGYCGSCGKFA
jgi:hypothetical protein